jgi:hypothetical protein
MFFGTQNKSGKYKNHKVEFNGIKFDSKKEMQRYILLKEAEDKGIIQDLKLQVRFELIPAIKEEYVEHLKTKDKIKTRTVQLPITYTCDFQYYKNGELVVEDVKASKSMLPKEFILKEKMMYALKGIRIKKVFSAKESV